MKHYNLIYFPEINSTNTYALKNISDYSDSDVLMAEIQTEGRGRFDRKWISDKPENIYISIVLKPELTSPLNNIPQYLSIKVCETLESYGVKPVIKWPNDVLINNKKIAGILAQTSIRGTNLQGLILGIGINLNFEQKDMESIDRPATSLNLLIDRHIDRDEFLKNLLEGFFTDYDKFLETGFDFIRKDYLNRAYFIGNTITINTYNEEIKGVAKGISNDGSLVIIPENCENELKINMGEILEF